jgi:dTDP-4-dehydrorhamnose 3,5-epimerase-like enzyme
MIENKIKVEFIEQKVFHNVNIGDLTVVDLNRNFPIEVKRIYYTYNVKKDVIRGFHAHRNTKQVLFCLNGEIKVCLDNGKHKKDIIINNPTKGLFVDKGIWHTMPWMKDNSILLVFASTNYDESDYIRSYDEYLKKITGGDFCEDKF